MSATGGRRAVLARGAFVSCALLATALPLFFTASAISYVPFVTVVLFAVFDVAYLAVLCRSLEFRLEADQLQGDAIVCERGCEAGISVSFRNKSALVFPRVEVEFYISDLFGSYASRLVHSTTVMPFEQRELPMDARFRHLGHYTAGISEVVVYDLVGLLSRTLDSPLEQAVTVTPRLFDVGRVPLSSASPRESTTASKPIVTDDMDYAGVREYRFGDPLKTVHWKLSSRMPDGELYTRLFEIYGSPGLETLVDPVAPDYGPEQLMHVFDGLMEAALSVNLYARGLGLDAQLAYFDRSGEPQTTQIADATRADALIEGMKRIEPLSQSPDPDAGVRLLRREGASSRGMGNIAFCTARLTPQLVSVLGEIRMRRRSPMLFLVVPQGMDDGERSAFLAPLKQLDAAQVPYFIVEPTAMATEVRGL